MTIHKCKIQRLASYDSPKIGRNSGTVYWSQYRTIHSKSLGKELELLELFDNESNEISASALFNPRFVPEFESGKIVNCGEGFLMTLKSGGCAENFDDYRHISAARFDYV